MKVALVEFAGRGGLIHYAYQLASALAAAGAEVTLVTDESYELDRLDAGFRVIKLLRLWDPKPSGERRSGRFPAFLARFRRAARAIRYYREWWRLAAYLRRESFDVIHLGDVRFAPDAIFHRLLRGSTAVLADTCHNLAPFAASGRAAGLSRRSALVAALYRRVYAGFDAVFVHFESNRREFLARYRLDPGRVVALPHGNEAIFAQLKRPALTAADLRRDLDLAGGTRVVLFFGTLSRYKGVDVLIEAFARLSARVPAARLVIAGFPAADFDVEAHRARARDLGVGASVRFVPRYLEADEIAAWMECAEVAVFPYREIFQSGAVHVPLTLGVPVVATRVGAIPEVVEDGRTGLLVPPEDPAALAEAIERLLSDVELALRLAGAARVEAHERFAWRAIAATTLATYRRLLASRPERAP